MSTFGKNNVILLNSNTIYGWNMSINSVTFISEEGSKKQKIIPSLKPYVRTYGNGVTKLKCSKCLHKSFKTKILNWAKIKVKCVTKLLHSHNIPGTCEIIYTICETSFKTTSTVFFKRIGRSLLRHAKFILIRSKVISQKIWFSLHKLT